MQGKGVAWTSLKSHKYFCATSVAIVMQSVGGAGCGKEEGLIPKILILQNFSTFRPGLHDNLWRLFFMSEKQGTNSTCVASIKCQILYYIHGTA